MTKEIYHEGWLIKSPPTKGILRAVSHNYRVLCFFFLSFVSYSRSVLSESCVVKYMFCCVVVAVFFYSCYFSDFSLKCLHIHIKIYLDGCSSASCAHFK